MKTLYVGYYDYWWNNVCEFIDDKVINVDINISKNDINDIVKYIGTEDKIEWYNSLSDRVKQYDKITMCNYGRYLYIDLTKFKRNPRTTRAKNITRLYR